MLLKSWATPPARRPTDSIFWACRSWTSSLARSASALLRSVMSWVVPIIERILPSLSKETVPNPLTHRTSPSFLRTIRYSLANGLRPAMTSSRR